MEVAIVTGASRGIGAAIAQRLAAEGCAVGCVARTLTEGDSHLEGSLQRTVERITTTGGRALPLMADLSSPDLDATAMVSEVEAELGPVDYLVNNAAAAFYPSFLEMPRKRMEISFRVNVAAPWLLAQAVLPAMVERGSGSVLNLTSQTAIMPEGPPFNVPSQIKGATAYGGSKAWLERATVGAAAELFGTGVSCNALSPDTSVITEGAGALVDLSQYPNEPVEVMAEAAWILLTGDRSTFTGRIEYALSLLHRMQHPVHELDGKTLLDGWQPGEFSTENLVVPEGR